MNLAIETSTCCLLRHALIVFAVLLSGCTLAPPDTRQLERSSSPVRCPDSNTPWVPSDPALPGPWPVGHRTVMLEDARNNLLKTEIWYPGQQGSETGIAKTTYDLRQFLPPGDAAKVPVGALMQACDCYPELPVTQDLGAMPVIFFIHGTASFRTASLSQMVHWASRGFITIALDHPHIQLKDLKANPLGVMFADQPQDVVEVITRLQNPTAEFHFIEHQLDPQRIGISGHSAGAFAAEVMNSIPGVQVLAPLAGRGVKPGAQTPVNLVMAAEKDALVAYSGTYKEYRATAPPKYFVGLANAGHLAFTDLCGLGQQAGGVIPWVRRYGVEISQPLVELATDGCGASYQSLSVSRDIINYATTAAFEAALQCRSDAAHWLSLIGARYGTEISHFDSEL